MRNTIKNIGNFIVVILAISFLGVYGGTIIWLLYPHIHALFPMAAPKGIIPQRLNWWDAVCISWIANTLTYRHADSSNNKN